MTNNAQKTPFARSMHRFAEGKIADALELLGKALPCSVVSVDGAIVTVKFEVQSDVFTFPQVVMPIFGPEYVRYPIQPGCLGFAIPADVAISGVDGLGDDVATLVRPANLSALVFFPIGNKKWSATDDPDAVVIYGPNGVVLRDAGSHTKAVLTPDGLTVTGKTTIKLQVGSSSITITSSGVDIEGTLTINGQAYLDHTHSGVSSGADDTGPVVP